MTHSIEAFFRDFPDIQTERLQLRRLRYEDEAALHDILAKPRIGKWIAGLKQDGSRQAVRDWLKDRIERMERCRAIEQAICHNQTGMLVGWSSVRHYPERGEIKVGCGLDVPFWGKGFIEEFSGVIFERVFTSLPDVTLCATCDVENWPSRRLAYYFNMQEGERRTVTRPDGSERLSLFFTYTRANWEQRRYKAAPLELSADEQRQLRKDLLTYYQDMQHERRAAR